MPNPRRVPAHFAVQAESRHPRLADYSTAAHDYTDAYLHPGSYAINMEDFPGMTLALNRGDQSRPRPGQPDHNPQDIYKLDCPNNTTGWRFTLSGRPDSAPRFGPKRPTVKLSQTLPLRSVMGPFRPELTSNPWNCRFTVPGEGIYTVTVERMAGTVVSKSASRKLHIRDFLVVSIGDSAASGQGNPDIPGEPEGFDSDLTFWDVFIPGAVIYKLSKAALKWGRDKVVQNQPQIARKGSLSIAMDPEPVWQEPKAQRSLRGSHAFAAKLCEDRSVGTVVSYLGFGRTGSTIPGGLLGPRTDSNGRSTDDWANDRGQVAEVADAVGQRRIDALIIQIGVNDVGVSGTLESLVSGDFTGPGPTQSRRDAEAKARQNLTDLPARFVLLKSALSALNIGQVYLVEYPTGLFDDKNGDPQHACELFNGPSLDLSKRDAEMIKSLAHDLNMELAAQAQTHGWIFVSGVESKFEGHGYCRGDDDRWFRTCSESLLLQGDTEGTIHPNRVGHEVIAGQIASRISKYTLQPALVADGSTTGATQGLAPLSQ